MDPSYAPTVHTQSDLEAVWRYLMGPWGFGGASIWLLLVLPDGSVVPRLTEIAEADEPPGADDPEPLTALVHELGPAPGTRLAFLRSRPGGPDVTAVDRAWAESLYAGARATGLPCEIVHLATEGDVRPLPPDELATTA